MKIEIKTFFLILKVIILNADKTFAQQSYNNDFVVNDLQNLLKNTQTNVQNYLQKILNDAIIKNVNDMFDSAMSNLTTIIKKSYVCNKITIITTTTPNIMVPRNS